MNMPGWEIIHAGRDEQVIWEAILSERERIEHLRDKSRAALNARAMNGKG